MIKKNELVYICSPLSAPTEQQMRANMKKASEYAKLVVRQFHCRAIAPHSFLPAYLDDRIPEEREICLAFGIFVLKLCRAVIVCGNRISSGMEGEIRTARECSIPVYSPWERPDGFALVREEERRRKDEVQICAENILQQR